MVILDVVDGRIRYVEVLYREDVNALLSALTEQPQRPARRCAEDVGGSSGRSPVEVRPFRGSRTPSDLQLLGGRGGT